jgi:SulP family sulfate permease
VQQLSEHELHQEFGHQGFTTLPRGVLVYAVEGPLFFGAVENFERALANTHTDPRVLVIRLRWVPFIDITGLQTLEEVIHDVQKRGVRVILAGANQRVTAKLERAGITDLVGRANVLASLTEALAVCRQMAETNPAMSKGRKIVISENAEAVMRTSRDYFAPNMVQPTEGDR